MKRGGSGQKSLASDATVKFEVLEVWSREQFNAAANVHVPALVADTLASPCWCTLEAAASS